MFEPLFYSNASAWKARQTCPLINPPSSLFPHASLIWLIFATILSTRIQRGKPECMRAYEFAMSLVNQSSSYFRGCPVVEQQEKEREGELPTGKVFAWVVIRVCLAICSLLVCMLASWLYARFPWLRKLAKYHLHALDFFFLRRSFFCSTYGNFRFEENFIIIQMIFLYLLSI